MKKLRLWGSVQSLPAMSLLLSMGCSDNNEVPVPTEVPFEGTFSQISVGYDYVCAIKEIDGTIVCKGYDGSLDPRAVYLREDPVARAPTGSFTQISAGLCMACGIRTDGETICWGRCLAEDTSFGNSYMQVTAGDGYACGLGFDGRATCWGNNYHGQATPPALAFRRISAGDYCACGIVVDGDISCWGDCITDAIPSDSFSDLSVCKDICTVKSNHQGTCWMASYNDKIEEFYPIVQIDFRWLLVQVDASADCGVTTSGDAVCLVENSRQMCEFGGCSPCGETSPPPGKFIQIETGSFSCGLKTDHTVLCWGAKVGHAEEHECSQESP